MSNSYKCREVDKKEWSIHWPKIKRSNLMQSWEYGDAKVKSEGWKAKRYLFEDSYNQPVGLAQVLSKTFPIIGGVARINRGPLLLNLGATEHDELIKLDLIKVLKRLARSKRWWLLYMAPEILESDSYTRSTMFQKLNLKGHISRWASARLSLEIRESELMSGLNGKWRNILRKAFKSNLSMSEVTLTRDSIDELIKFYESAQKEIGFSGISSQLLKAICNISGEYWKVCYFAARDDVTSELNGILVSIVHGDTATYLIGNTNEAGRKTNANYLMLWNAILDAKSAGCKWYDLGGINKKTSKGVAHFKSGVNADYYQLIGELKTIPILSYK